MLEHSVNDMHEFTRLPSDERMLTKTRLAIVAQKHSFNLLSVLMMSCACIKRGYYGALQQRVRVSFATICTK